MGAAGRTVERVPRHGDLLTSEEGVVLVPGRLAAGHTRRRLGNARSGGTNALVYLAGLRIPDEDVRELIQLVDDPTRSLLEKALGLETEVVALTIDDRERILWALDDARTDALAELRGVLLQEHEWRREDSSSPLA
jgi:hypothetical protein